MTIHRVCCLILSFSFVFLFRVNALMNHFYLNYISNASVSWTDIATGVSAEFLKSCFMLFPSWETWKPSGLPFVKILEVIHLQSLIAIQTCYPGNCLWQETRSSARRHLKEPDSPVVVIRKCIAVSRKNFMVVEGFVHVCFAASQKDIQYINLFCSQPRDSVTLSTQ